MSMSNIITPKRVKLSIGHLFVHYSFSLLILLTPILNLISILKIWMGNYTGRRTLDDYIIDSVPFLLVGLLFIGWQYNKLKFKRIMIEHTDKDYQHAIGKTIADLKWRVDKNREGYFRAHRVGDGLFTLGYWGEMITIIRDGNNVFINSISDPNQSPTFSSFGYNRRNVNTFIKNLKTIVAQKKE